MDIRRTIYSLKTSLRNGITAYQSRLCLLLPPAGLFNHMTEVALKMTHADPTNAKYTFEEWCTKCYTSYNQILRQRDAATWKAAAASDRH